MWKVNLRAPLHNQTGYGRDGIGLARALTRRVLLTLNPTFVAPPLPHDIAEMLTLVPSPPHDLSIHHISPMELGLTQGQRDEADLCVAWTMWEYPKFSDSLHSEVKARLTGYDAVVVYDSTSAEAFQSLEVDIPVIVLQGGYEPEQWRGGDATRNWHSEDFAFVIAGDLTPRKNPYAAARVVQRLADEGYKVCLKMKTWGVSPALQAIADAYPVVQFHSGSWPQSRMQELYSSSHCYLGPSWGEGKNLPAIEAGTSGCALILSDCGGHQQWARPEFATLVGGRTNEYAEMPYLEVDEEALYEACRALVEDRNLARNMGFQASQILPSQLSWDRVTQDFLMLAARRFH